LLYAKLLGFVSVFSPPPHPRPNTNTHRQSVIAA